MSHLSSRLLQIGGVVLLVFGVLFLADGLLPLRSAGPNPSWFEVVVGVVLCIVGWLLRRASLPKTGRV
jgi:hypothetical protein